MSPKGNLTPATKTRLSLKRSLLYGAGAIAIGAIVWKLFFTTAATIATTTDVSAMFTPGTGPVVSGHTWEATLTVDHTKVADTGDITDFPLLVQLTLPELKSTSFGGNVVSPAGFDIFFAGGNHHQLDHQLELYDPTTGSLTAWVRLPILYKNVDTELTIMCGNPNVTSDPSTEAVWDSTFQAVWHMSDNPGTSDLIDYANNLDAQPQSSMNSFNLVQGKIGQAIDFDGNNDYFAIKNQSYQTQGEITEFSISAWVNTSFSNSSWTSNWAILDFDRSEKFHVSVHGEGYVSFCTRNANGGIDDMFAGNSGQVNNGQWQHIIVTYKAGVKKIYLNGVLIGTQTQQQGNSIGSSATRFGFIGDGSEANSFNGGRNNRHYEGMIDELRLVKVAHSPGRVQTEFNNQSSPETFVTLGNISSLPIELDEFTAILEGDQVLTKWNVISQLNNDFFTVERATDGLDFKAIGTVDGAGTTQSEKKYSFVDKNPEIGINYYRLRQTDFDGKTETFDPVAVEYIPEIESISIDKAYPNPFTNQFKVEFTVNEATYVQFSLINSNGTTIAGDTRYVYEGSNTYEFNTMETLPSGMYFFHITQDGSKKATIKLMRR